MCGGFVVLQFKKKRLSLASMSLYDISEELCRYFSLDSLVEDRPYIHTLLSHIFEYQNTHGSNIGDFLRDWEEKKDSVACAVGSVGGSLRVMTIHKSKGLEAKVVMVPFCHWGLFLSGKGILWQETGGDSMFGEIDELPLPCVKALQGTFFEEGYNEERFLYFLDELNLLYVAFTRAKEELYVSYDGNKAKKSIKGKESLNVGDLLAALLFNGEKEAALASYSSGEKGKGSKGDKVLEERAETAGDYGWVSEGRPYPFITRDLRVEKATTSIDIGKYVHKTLSSVRSGADFAHRYANLGENVADVVRESYAIISKAFAGMAQLRIWYTQDRYALFFEREIWCQGVTKRIDMLAVGKDEVDVVEFKAGRGKRKEHVSQLKDYLVALSSVSFRGRRLRGFLVYLRDLEVQEVG